MSSFFVGTIVFRKAFLKLQFGFVIFWLNNIGAKAANKMFENLTIERHAYDVGLTIQNASGRTVLRILRTLANLTLGPLN